MLKKIAEIICCLLIGWHTAQAAPAAVSSADARSWANTKGQELIQALSESNPVLKYSKLDKMLTEDVNLDYVSKFVIGKYAKIMNKEQQLRYSSLFYRYVLSLYKQIDLKFSPDAVDFSVEAITEHPKFTTVNCIVDPSRLIQNISAVEPQKIPVNFKLIRSESNRIQAVDVEISNISLVLEYRRQFYNMIREESENIDWFLDKFNDKVIANETAFYQKAGM